MRLKHIESDGGGSPELGEVALWLLHPLLGVDNVLLHVKVGVTVVLEEFGHLHYKKKMRRDKLNFFVKREVCC